MPLPFAQASNARACFDCLKKLLSRDVFEQRTLTGREVFSLLVYLAATKFVLLIVFFHMQTICQNIWVKPLPKKENCLLLGDLRCSKTSLLKLPIYCLALRDNRKTCANMCELDK